VQSLSKLITEFFFWDLVDPLSWNEALVTVNILPVVVENRGNVHIELQGNGKSGTISAYIWYITGVPIHGELSLSYTVAAGQDLTRTEIRQLKQIYDILQDPTVFPELNSADPKAVTDVVYERSRFCATF